MSCLKKFVIVAATVVFVICFYSFLGGQAVFEGKFDNDYMAWYILAKGIFCSFALYLLVILLEK